MEVVGHPGSFRVWFLNTMHSTYYVGVLFFAYYIVWKCPISDTATDLLLPTGGFFAALLSGLQVCKAGTSVFIFIHYCLFPVAVQAAKCDNCHRSHVVFCHLFKHAFSGLFMLCGIDMFFIYYIFFVYHFFATHSQPKTCPCIFSIWNTGAHKRKCALYHPKTDPFMLLFPVKCNMCISRFRVEAVMYSDSPL